MSKRNKIPGKKIHQVFMKTNGVCFYCECDLPEDTIFTDWGGKEIARKRNWHIDHIYPVSKGGSDDIINLVPSCSKCNLEKGAK